MRKALISTLAVLLPTGLAAQDSRAEYDELVAAFKAETAKFRKPDAKLRPLLPDVSPSHQKFVDAAKRHAGTEESLPFLGWLLQNSPRNKVAHAAAVSGIDALAQSRAAELREAGKSIGQLAKDSRKAVKHLKYNTVTDEVFARTLLDCKAIALAATDKATAEAKRLSAFKLERLQVGMVAPDIVGKDLDGVSFKLSDYRGKIVVVDFWGDW